MPDKRNTRKELAWGIQFEAAWKERAQKVADEIKVEFPTAGNVYIPEADRLRIEEEVQLKPYNDRGPRLSPLNKSIYKDHGRLFIGDPCYPDGITSICGNNYYINDNFEVVPID